MKNLFHISHVDLDGETPIAVTSTMCAADGLYNVTAFRIVPNDLVATLKSIKEGEVQPDIVIVTDIAITKEAVRYLWDSGLIRITCYMDHHTVGFDPVEYSDSDEVNELKKHCNPMGSFMAIDAADHFFVTPELNGKMTSGTDIYLSKIIAGDFDNIFNYEVEGRDIIFTVYDDYGKPCVIKIDAEKMKYLKDVVTAWDTRTWDEDPDAMMSQDAVRLNTLFHYVDKTTFGKFIADYLTCPDIEWQNMTIGNPHYSIYCEFLSVIIEKDNIISSRKAQSAIKYAWTPKYKNQETNEITEYRTVTAGIVIADALSSDTGAKILKYNEDCDIAIVLRDNSASLYSRKGSDIMVNEIAALYGGGGHPNAAGFPIDKGTSEWMRRNYFIGTTNVLSGIAASKTIMEDGKEIKVEVMGGE